MSDENNTGHPTNRRPTNSLRFSALEPASDDVFAFGLTVLAILTGVVGAALLALNMVLPSDAALSPYLAASGAALLAVSLLAFAGVLLLARHNLRERSKDH